MRINTIKILIIILLFVFVFEGHGMNFLEKAFLHNQHLAWHVYGGTLITLSLLKITDMAKEHAFLITFGVAVLYEIIEYFTSNVIKTYGNMDMFIADSFGDVMGASIASFTIIIML